MSRSEAPIYEYEIQRIWAEQDFDSSGLKTVDGKKIEIFSPGWWNQGLDPDFEAARLSIGDDFSEVPLKSIFRVRDGRPMDITGIRPTNR